MTSAEMIKHRERMRSIYKYVSEISSDSVIADTAIGLCVVREWQPYALSNTPWGELARWRAVVMETIMMDNITSIYVLST